MDDIIENKMYPSIIVKYTNEKKNFCLQYQGAIGQVNQTM